MSSIHEDVTPSDKVLNDKSKFLCEILMILESKPVENYSFFSSYATQTVLFHTNVKLNDCTFWWYV